jgi:hypothetical protein
MQYITGEKTAVELEEYKGVYSLSDCYIGKDGDIKKNWAKKQKGRDEYWDKPTPIKVTLGDIDKAIQTMQGILDDLMSLSGQVNGGNTSKDNDVPWG